MPNEYGSVRDVCQQTFIPSHEFGIMEPTHAEKHLHSSGEEDQVSELFNSPTIVVQELTEIEFLEHSTLSHSGHHKHPNLSGIEDYYEISSRTSESGSEEFSDVEDWSPDLEFEVLSDDERESDLSEVEIHISSSTHAIIEEVVSGDEERNTVYIKNNKSKKRKVVRDDEVPGSFIITLDISESDQ